MSVRLNLLPDLRQQRLKEKQLRQTATVGAVIVWIVVGGITLVLALYHGAQKFTINDLTNKIAGKESQLTGNKDLIKALTAESALRALPGLYSQRVYFSKFFVAYTQSQPKSVALSSLSVDGNNTLQIAGTAVSYTEVAKLAEAMSADNVTVGVGANAGNQPYFTNVNITQVSQGSSAQVQFALSATMGAGATSGN